MTIEIGDEIESCENGKWYKAKVISIQKPGIEVTIHYKGWNQKWDKKINLTSPSVRFPKKELKEKKHCFSKGQKVMALFTDNNKYAAEILEILPDLKYTVKYYDGIVKKIPETSIDKFTEKANREAQLKAEELYGIGIEQPATTNTPLNRSERRRSTSRPRSEVDSVRSGRSTPEQRRSRSTTPVPSKITNPVMPKTTPRSIAQKSSPERSEPRRSTLKRKSTMKSTSEPEPEMDITPKFALKSAKIGPKSQVSREDRETPSRPSRARPSRTFKEEGVKLEKNIPEISKRPKRSLQQTDDREKEMNEFDFSDNPDDVVLIGDGKDSNTEKIKQETKKENRKSKATDDLASRIQYDDSEKDNLMSLLGENGFDKWVEVKYQDKWIAAKIIHPPKKDTPKSKKDQPREKAIFIHYHNWSKSHDQWIQLDNERVRIAAEPKKEPKLEWKNETELLGLWDRNQYYPCKVIGLSGSCYNVEFYDGFRKRLPASALKEGTQQEFKDALALAEQEFGNNAEANAKPKQRKSIFKRNGAEDEVPSEEKLTFLGKKRKRPSSFSSNNSTTSSPVASPRRTVTNRAENQEQYENTTQTQRIQHERLGPGKKQSKIEESKVTPLRNSANATQTRRSSRFAQKEDQNSEPGKREIIRTRRSTLIEKPNLETKSVLTKNVEENMKKEHLQNPVENTNAEPKPKQIKQKKVEKKSARTAERFEETTVETEKITKEEKIKQEQARQRAKAVEEQQPNTRRTVFHELHQREKELDEAKRKIELEKEQLRNERHNARQKVISGLNPILQGVCKKAISELNDDEADMLLQTMIQDAREPETIGNNVEKPEVSGLRSELPPTESKVQPNELLTQPVSGEKSDLPKPKQEKKKTDEIQTRTKRLSRSTMKESSSVIVRKSSRKSPEKDSQSESEKRLTRSKGAIKDTIEILKVDTANVEEKNRQLRKSIRNEPKTANTDSPKPTKLELPPKEKKPDVIITDPKPNSERRRTRTSSNRSTSGSSSLTSQKVDNEKIIVHCPTVTISNPPIVSKMISEIKKNVRVSPRNSASPRSARFDEHVPSPSVTPAEMITHRETRSRDKSQDKEDQAKEGDTVKSPRSTRSNRATVERTEQDSEKLPLDKYKLGDLVWVKWSDTRPYGAVIFGYMDSEEGYKLRFALDGLEKEFKFERITELWDPTDHLTDDFLIYFDKMFKKEDSMEVKAGLFSVKRKFLEAIKQFKEAQKHTIELKNGNALEKSRDSSRRSSRKSSPRMISSMSSPKVVENSSETNIEPDQKPKMKPKKSLNEKLAELQQKKMEKVEKKDTNEVESVQEPKKPRKNPPTRRISGVSSSETKTYPVVQTVESKLADKSQKNVGKLEEPATQAEPQPTKYKPDTDKHKPKIVTPTEKEVTPEIRSNPEVIKSKLEAVKPKPEVVQTKSEVDDEDASTTEQTSPIATRRSLRREEKKHETGNSNAEPDVPEPRLKLMPKSVKEKLENPIHVPDDEDKTAPLRLKLMPKSVKEKLEKKGTDEPDIAEPANVIVDTPNSPIVSPRVSMTGGGGITLGLKTPEHTPVFEIGDNVMITSGTSAGRGASIMKTIPRASGVEYYLRVFNGPKVKRKEDDLRKMDGEETKRVENIAFVVRPALDSIIDDAMAKSDRKKKEIKRLDHSVNKGLPKQVNSPLPPRAFSGVENEFKCSEPKCDKTFRKSRMLDAHLKHYHKDRVQTSPASSVVFSDNSSLISEPTEEPIEVFEQEEEIIDTIDTRTKTIFQCSCGWEGTEFWSQNPSGVPIRNHICQRPQKARNLKETQMRKEIYRTVDVGDYYEGFKLQVFPDQATQELVREVNKLQNEVVERVAKPCQEIRERLKKLRPSIDSLKTHQPDEILHSTTGSPAVGDDFEFSVAEGVSTAQNAFPDTHSQSAENKHFSAEELTMLKTVDSNDAEMMEIYSENAKRAKILDELEEYVIHMERDLDQKGL